MSEHHPSFTFEQAPIHEGTRLEDGTELDLQTSRLGTPEQGRALAEAARVAETVLNPERRHVYGHEDTIPATHYTLANRHSEMIGSETLVFRPRRGDDFDLAA